jgi:DNA-binding response OmpR family regulator
MRHPNQVIQREQIIAHVWDQAFDSFSNVVDVHIKNLRKKLQKSNENIFETIHGVGYKLRD